MQDQGRVPATKFSLAMISAAALFGGALTVLAVEFPFYHGGPFDLFYFASQFAIFSVEIGVFYLAGLIAIGVPCWLALQARGIHQWWAAFALGAVLGTAAGCALIWAAQFIYLGDSCAAFHACTEPTALNRVIEIGKTATLVAVIPGLTGLLIWRLTRARPVLTP